MQFDAGTAATGVSIGIGDNVINVNESFASGDTLLVNCKNKEVMKNSNTNVLFTGKFPHLEF